MLMCRTTPCEGCGAVWHAAGRARRQAEQCLSDTEGCGLNKIPSDMAAQCCCLVWGAVCMQGLLFMALDFYYSWNQLVVSCSMSWPFCAQGGPVCANSSRTVACVLCGAFAHTASKKKDRFSVSSCAHGENPVNEG